MKNFLHLLANIPANAINIPATRLCNVNLCNTANDADRGEGVTEIHKILPDGWVRLSKEQETCATSRNLRGGKIQWKKAVNCNETLGQKKQQKRDASLNERSVSAVSYHGMFDIVYRRIRTSTVAYFVVGISSLETTKTARVKAL